MLTPCYVTNVEINIFKVVSGETFSIKKVQHGGVLVTATWNMNQSGKTLLFSILIESSLKNN